MVVVVAAALPEALLRGSARCPTFFVVLLHKRLCLLAWELREDHLIKQAPLLGHHKVGFHLKDGNVRHILPFFLFSLLTSPDELFICGHYDYGSTLEALEGAHFAPLCRRVHIGLVKNIVARSLGGHLEQLVETLGGLFDEDVPAA